MGIFGNDEIQGLKNRVRILESKFESLYYMVERNKYKDIYDFIDKNPEMKYFVLNSTGALAQKVIYELLVDTFSEITIAYNRYEDYGYDYYIGYDPICLSKVIEDLEAMRTKLKEAKQND